MQYHLESLLPLTPTSVPSWKLVNRFNSPEKAMDALGKAIGSVPYRVVTVLAQRGTATSPPGRCRYQQIARRPL